MKEKRQHMDRRDFMQFAGAGALAAAGTLGLGRVREAHAQDKAPFRILGGAEDLIEPVFKGYEKAFGRPMEGTLKGHAEVNNMMLTGGDRVYDAAET